MQLTGNQAKRKEKGGHSRFPHDGGVIFIKKEKKTKTRSSLGRRFITNLLVKRLTTGQPGVARNPPAGVGAQEAGRGGHPSAAPRGLPHHPGPARGRSRAADTQAG